MQLTKFTHSCVRLDEGDRTLVIDPGVFSEVDQALDGADAIIITHEHADHVNADAVRAAAKANSSLRIWTTAATATALDLGDQVTTVGAGETIQAAGFEVRTFGGQHALIHPTVPVVANVAVLVEGRVYHPGDSLVVPPIPIDTLLVPLNAPWSKVSEVIDFVVSVRAPRTFQIHDGLVNERGFGVLEGHVTRFGAAHGSEYRHLGVAESVSV